MDHRIQSHQLHQLPKPKMAPKRQATSTTSFKDMFQSQIKDKVELKISKHAEKRLNDRGIVIDQNKWSQISSKVQEAKTKGVHDSLVVLRDAALVVSAKNNTVITALDRKEAKDQVFTNINGTILID
ncbi:flagellar protein [Anaerobacillus arseniciselenatis]|uniref:Flagellar protein n=1 Tax=Anaerobacillus arseniciselenatis TaxID=85682 RepID=A0A1S2LDU6_9BACI|nr:TIGR02530 family flagellar biosynthesis protein [Anaerobacillus arseniciselenatis]OIJ09907.1 flagellar protein [Anaerobacillus arseniciselenatis]